MVWTKFSHCFMALSAPLLLEMVMISGFLTTAQVEAKSPTQATSASRSKQVLFEPRQDQPAPRTTMGGGRRSNDECPQYQSTSEQSTKTKPPKSLDQLLTPLLPSPLTNLQLTVSAHPTFLVYVPQIPDREVVEVEFKLEDDNQEEIYYTTLNLAQTPGIISISLPTTKQALEMGKDYTWVVAIACHSEAVTPEDLFVGGVVRRIQPDSTLSQLDQVGSLERVVLYAKSGIWHDALANLAALRKAQPNDPKVVSAWDDLLKNVGLEAIATAPLMK